MKTKLLLTLALTLALLAVAGGAAQAQTQQPPRTAGAAGGAAGGPIPKTKIAIIDVLALREGISEWKAKAEKLKVEFAPAIGELEAMKTKLAAQEKTLNENQNLTPQQAAKLSQDFEEGKKIFQRQGEDLQTRYEKREDEETGPIKEKMSKYLIEQYCVKHGITYVFDARALQETGAVIYVAAGANITDDFIKEYNKANPAPAGAASVK